MKKSDKNLVNSLQDDKIKEWSKLKVAADETLNKAQIIEFAFVNIENIVWKRDKMLVISIFSFPMMFLRKSSFMEGVLNPLPDGKF